MYARQARIGRLRSALREQATVTEAMNAAGYNSTSRLHEDAASRLGMSPTAYRRGGRGVSIHHAFVPSPVGNAAIAWTDRGVCFAEFSDSPNAALSRLAAEYPEAELIPAQLDDWQAALRILNGPVDVAGSVFQQMVWNYLRTIPSGETRSYAEVAAALGHPGAARAVARACATNRVAVGIPCHRVISANGDPAGYKWGVERKRELLSFERQSSQPALR
jgi:AraC family transcriptional regulator of adaptative response/methylated-DNA-[protein]-cysteine methyltransferase